MTVRDWCSRARRRWEATNADERGSITVWMALAAVAMILLAGLAVDLGGQVHTRQHAIDVAGQAARAGGQQLQEPAAVRGQGVRTEPGRAVAAARTFLAASDVHGTVALRGTATVVVTTTATYDTKFLGIIGINRLTVHGSAEARTVRAVDGTER